MATSSIGKSTFSNQTILSFENNATNIVEECSHIFIYSAVFGLKMCGNIIDNPGGLVAISNRTPPGSRKYTE